METSEPSPAAAAEEDEQYPRWVLLEKHGSWRDAPDAETVAEARTSSGHRIRVSFRFASPPAVSRACLVCPGQPHGVAIILQTFASHRDSVLLETKTAYKDNVNRDYTYDFFVYRAGDASAASPRPPSLSLLPPCYHKRQEEIDNDSEDEEDEETVRRRDEPKQRKLAWKSTGVLRRGEKLVVAELAIKSKLMVNYGELCVFRSGEWDVTRRLPILHDESDRGRFACWEFDMAIPVGDRFMYWVDLHLGIIYSDLSEESPDLRYVSLPVETVHRRRFHPEDNPELYRSVSVTAGSGGAVRFVEIFPRCCCGGRGATKCARSGKAFNITTWTLTKDQMTWTKDCIVDYDELWALPGYESIPRIKPASPVIRMDDDIDVVSFMVCKKPYHMDVDGENGEWLIELDTRFKQLRSVTLCGDNYYVDGPVLPSEVSKYFDMSHKSSNISLGSNACHQNNDEELHNINDGDAPPLNYTMDSIRASSPDQMASPEDILAVIQEIPDLSRGDMLRAYSVLICDCSQSKFRSLLALPFDTRKDHCLLMKHGDM